MTPYQRHPRFQELATYLAAKAPNGKLPGRQHVDPVEIPRLLPYLIAKAYDGVVATRTPHHWAKVMAVPGREHIRFERIVFPLARDGETIDMLIGVHAFAEP